MLLTEIASGTRQRRLLQRHEMSVKNDNAFLPDRWCFLALYGKQPDEYAFDRCLKCLQLSHKRSV